MALAAALELRKSYRQIYLARPIVPLFNRDIGYLPGDIKSNVEPYMQPLHDNLSVIQHQYPESSMEYAKANRAFGKREARHHPAHLHTRP